MQYEHIFAPIQIRGLELKSRIMMSSMVTKLAKDRHVTQELIDYHVTRTKGGLTLNFLEAASVHQPSASSSFLSIGEDEYIPNLKKLTDAVHQAGGKIGIQLWQGGMVAPLLDPTAECCIPCSVSMNVTVLSDVDAPPLTFPGATIEKIREIVKCHGDAAARAVKAGFDVIEFHVGHGYSPHAFLSPAFNQRIDEYGGSFEKRARFPLECIEAIRANIPEDMPLFMRIVSKDDALENGLTLDDMISFCNMAKDRGVDVVNVSRGNSFTAGALESPPVDMPRGFNVENAAKIKEATGLTTVAVGRINDPDQAEAILASNKADMVVMSRAHLADPEFCNKIKEGRVDDIVRCVGCNQGCNDIVATTESNHITCLMNPAVCRERDFQLKKVSEPKKVLVVGGGVAGIEAADILNKQGHAVVLIDTSDRLGGQFVIAGRAPRKEEFIFAVESRGRQLARAGVDIRLNTAFNANVLQEIKPDEVIIAIGAEPIIPNIPGKNRANVVAFPEVLNGYIVPEGNIAVIGAGMVGLEVAEYLQTRGRQVTIIEMLEEVGKGLGAMRKSLVMPELEKEQVQILTLTKCLEIKENSVVVEQDGNQREIPIDSVVLAIGSISRDLMAITALCDAVGIPYHTVGDAKKVTRAMEAIADAADVAMKI